MTRKGIILDSILNHPNLDYRPALIFGDVSGLISGMYDRFVQAKKDKVTIDDFLIRERAMTADQAIIRDFFIDGSFPEEDTKKMVKVNGWFPFKYPIFVAMDNKWQELEYQRQGQRTDNLAKQQKTAFIEAFGADDPEVVKQAGEIFDSKPQDVPGPDGK